MKTGYSHGDFPLHKPLNDQRLQRSKRSKSGLPGHWLPELQHLSIDHIHEPWRSTEASYPAPCVAPERFAERKVKQTTAMAVPDRAGCRSGARWRLICANYDNLTVLPSPGIMVNMGNHPQMAFIPVSEILYTIYPDPLVRLLTYFDSDVWCEGKMMRDSCSV